MLNAGNRFDPPIYFGIEINDRSAARILKDGQRELHREHVAGVKTGIDALQPREEALDQQTRTD